MAEIGRVARHLPAAGTGRAGEPEEEPVQEGADAGSGEGELGELVERLTERGADEEVSPAAGPAEPLPADAATLAAAEQIRARMAAGAAPAGLRRLAEALAEAEAKAASAVPRQRTATDEVAAPLTDVLEATRTESFLVLEGHRPAEVAAAVDDLAQAGLRVAVTAADLARLDAVAPTVDRLPALTGPEQRELRLLLATATPARREYAGREIPPPPAFPPLDEVRALCANAAGSAASRTGAPDLLRNVLTTLDEPRLAAAADLARAARAGLDALGPREGSWAWPLLADLVHSRHRSVFDALRTAAAAALGLADRARDLPLVTLAGVLPDHALELLDDYREYLETGGRARRRFRNGVQREVQPVLDLIRVGGEVPTDARSVHAAVLHVELADRLTAVDECCRTLGVPAPDDVGDLRALVADLARVDEAARAVGQLRHDVLFLHPTSPIAVPDLAAAEEVAAGILDVAEHGSAPEAAARLDAIADGLVGSVPVTELTAGHRAAVEALRARDAEAYEAALAALGPARREAADQARCDELLARLRAEDPEAARAYSDGRGFVWSVPLEALLSRLPADDVLDAVVVLDAAELSVERLLVAAAAPRLLAVAGAAAPADAGSTVLGALQRAEAPVVAPPRPPDPGGRVVRLPTARRPGAPRQEQAGA